MHNLEGILFEEVINEQGVSYAVFRHSLQPRYTITWVHIGGGLLCIVLLSGLCCYIGSSFPRYFWITIPVFSVITGFCIAYVNLFMHEAGHYYIHPRKKSNDILANIFLGSWTGVDIKVYRKIHWQHHLGLGGPADTENSYFHPLDLSFILETFTGVHLLRVIKNKSSNSFLGQELTTRSKKMLLIGSLINATIVITSLLSGNWQFTISWIFSILIFFPFFATVRQIAEHRDELALGDRHFYKGQKNKISRIFSNSVASRLFGPAGFNKHMIHHWDPHLPFTELVTAEKFLMNCPVTRPILESSRTSYFSVFKKLIFP